MVKIGDVMVKADKLIFVKTTDLISTVSNQIVTNHISSVLVQDPKEKKFVGIITKTDLVDLYWNGKIHHEKETKAGDVMETHLITCSEDDDLHKVVDLM